MSGVKKASGISKTLALIVDVGVLIVACVALVAVANYFTGYVVRGTRPIPGDASKFDPITAYQPITQFAGDGLKLVRIELDFVRADGTLDLTADYGAEARYTFAHVL